MLSQHTEEPLGQVEDWRLRSKGGGRQTVATCFPGSAQQGQHLGIFITDQEAEKVKRGREGRKERERMDKRAEAAASQAV